jgi:hypothetical protein
LLFTDRDVITVADLTAIDAQCATVAATQDDPIVLDGDMGIIRKAIEECGHEVLSEFQTYSGYLVSPSLSTNHVAAVQNTFSTSISRPRFRLNQMVALGTDPSNRVLYQWFAYSALYKLYRSAFARFSGKDDRFQRKMDLYNQERKYSWQRIESTGVPIVQVPLPCPGAIREPGAGVFSESNLSHGGSGSAETGQAYFVVITWTGPQYLSPAVPMQNESGSSVAAEVVPAATEKITVSIAGLNPPSLTPPNVGTADGLYTQVQASGWNVYVGLTASTLYLQNAAPIPVSTTTYTLLDKPVLSGSVAGLGQFPDYNYAWQKTRMRA